jgi:hypothetical protein
MCDVPAYFGDAVLADTEVELYAPVVDFLHSTFYTEQKPKYGNLRLIAEIVAGTPAPTGGMWTRPDVAAVGVRRHKFAATAGVDILSFEIKTYPGANLVSVYEALAHARFVNFSYLVWNRPACICGDRQHYAVIAETCSAQGIGLISVHNPHELGTFQIRVTPKRSSVSEDTLDEFVVSRFSAANQALIRGALQDFCPKPL